MLIKEAIKYLQEYKDQDQEIIIAWWDKDMFDEEDFETALENEHSVDWSGIDEQLTTRE